VYGALLTPLRATVLNLTEIGIFTGASVQVWHDFFPRARIFGMDLNLGLVHPASRRMLQALPRVTLLQGSAQSERDLATFSLAEASMDVVIDDGDHSPQGQQATLRRMWRFVRPGGLYIIEDVMTGAPDGTLPYKSVDPNWHCQSMLVHTPHNLTAFTRAVLAEHDSFFVDPLVGHRALGRLLQTPRTHRFMKDRLNSNTHMLIIRRRETPRSPLVRCLTARGSAMLKGTLLRAMLDTSSNAASRGHIESYMRSAGSVRCQPPDWACLEGARGQVETPLRCGGSCVDTSGAAVTLTAEKRATITN